MGGSAECRHTCGSSRILRRIGGMRPLIGQLLSCRRPVIICRRRCQICRRTRRPTRALDSPMQSDKFPCPEETRSEFREGRNYTPHCNDELWFHKQKKIPHLRKIQRKNKGAPAPHLPSRLCIHCPLLDYARP